MIPRQLIMLFVFLVLLSAGSTRSTRIHVEPDGGYSGIVIKISEDVPEDDCAEIIQNIRTEFSSASRVLHSALDNKVYFKTLIVVVPNAWTDSKCKTSIRVPRGATAFADADILVTMDHPIHRGSPWTQQSRGCGQPAEFSVLPHGFLTDINGTREVWGDPAKLIVHEWAKLRYGVFDEFGFSGDPLYPNYYTVDGAIRPTGTSDHPVLGTWRTSDEKECLPSTENCFFVPAMEGNDNVKCSLGYLPFLPNVTSFCDASVPPVAPTKHNVLCEGRSAMEVIMQHEDFVHLSSVQEPQNLFPTVQVVREPSVQYVLVMEASSSMSQHDLWTWISKAAQKFIRFDLPSSSKLALVTFTNESTVNHKMAVLQDDATRGRIADIIPDKYRVQEAPNQRCVLCGVEAAMNNVLAGSEAGAHIILISRGDNGTLSLTDEKAILEQARYYNVKFSSILLPDRQKALSFYDKVSSLSGGRTFVFPDSGSNTDLYVKMVEAFRELRALDSTFPSDIPVQVHSSAVSRERLVTDGSFTIDGTLGRDTTFGIFVEDVYNHFIKSITFTDSQGKTYGPFGSLSSEFNAINMRTINFPQISNTDTKPPFDDPAHLGMTWRYSVQWHKGGDTTTKNVISVTSLPRNVGTFGLIDIDMWTSSDSAIDIVTSQHPLAIFVQIKRGSSPVLSANVRVVVSVDNGDASPVQSEPITLNDNGNGDPDLTSGDGIYSRYLTQYPSAGRYRFTVTVDDNEGSAFTIQTARNGRAMPVKPPTPGMPVCCGSRVDVPQELRNPTGTFRRSAAGPVVHLLSELDEKNDKMPPSRIGDLRIAVEDGGTLAAEWTAPGDDFDSGRTASYEFVFAEDIATLIDPSGKPETMHSFARADEAGSASVYKFAFRRYDRDYHIGLYAFDELGNRGKLSNIVRVRLEGPGPTTDGVPPVTDDSGTDWIMVGIIVGVILTLLLCLLVGLYVYFCLLRRRALRSPVKSSGVNVDLHHTGSDHTDASSYESDLKNSSSNHLVPQISTISNVYKQQQQVPQPLPKNGDAASTSFANGITPTYWSASQLLREHEERKQRESRMGSIAEENHGYDPNDTYHQYGGYFHDNMTLANSEGFTTTDLYYGNNMYPMPEQQQQQYNQRYSTSDVMYHPEAMYQQDNFPENFAVDGSDTESVLHRKNNNNKNNTTLPKSSDSSAGTLGLTNPSLQGSLLSVDGPGSNMSKTRNITQV